MGQGYLKAPSSLLTTSTVNLGSSQSMRTSSKIYSALTTCPTRSSGEVAVFFTWNMFNDEKFKGLVSVRLYVTSTNPKDLVVNDNWSLGDSNPFSNSMTVILNRDITSEASEGDLYRGWIPSGYYVGVGVQYKYDNAVGGKATFTFLNDICEDNVISNTPSFTYNTKDKNFSIGTSMEGRRIIEFYNADHPYGYPTEISDVETLNEMYYASLMSSEFYDNPYCVYYYSCHSDDCRLTRWKPGRYTVGVSFNTSNNKDIISSAIDSALREVNNVLNSYDVYFTRSGTSGDITITVDTHYNLYGTDASEEVLYGGTWSTTEDDGGNIISASIKLANDCFDYQAWMTYETIAMEEIAQAMGAGYDQWEYPFNTLHTEFNYYNKSASLSKKDKNILDLVYSDAVSAGDNYTDVALNLNIPKGCYAVGKNASDVSTTVSAYSFLKPGYNYKARVFIVNSQGQVSETSDWIDVNFPYDLTPTDLIIERTSGNSLKFSWDGAEDAIKYNVILKRNWDGVEYTQTVYDKVCEFKDLNYGVAYTLSVQACNNFAEGEYTFDTLVLTNPAPPDNLVATYRAAEGIYLDFIDVSYSYSTKTNVSEIDFKIYDSSRNYLHTSTVRVDEGDQFPSGIIEIEDIYKAGETYFIVAEAVLWYENTFVMSYNSTETSITIPLKITAWNWNISNGSASALQTQAAYDALISKGETRNFSYEVWNDFINKVRTFLTYLNMSDVSIGESVYDYPSTTTYSQLLRGAEMNNTEASGKRMTAKRFNIVRYVIGSSCPNSSFNDGSNSIATHQADTGSWDMKPGEIVKGQYFLDLAAYANKMIE